MTTLGWPGFPETRGEFSDFQSFRTHDLDVLLSLSGRERHVRAAHMTDWSEVARWDSEARYRRVGSVNQASAAAMLKAVSRLLRRV